MIETIPLISVIVTTYNRKELLKETIESILSQTYKNFELIIIDNFSNYEFLLFIESFNDSRICSYQNKNNGVIAVNRNFGIKKSMGEYIAFCDDDDIWLPNKLESQLQGFNNGIIGIGTNAIVFGDAPEKLKFKYLDKDIIVEKNEINLIKSIPFSSLLIKTKDIYFNESRMYTFAEDFLYKLDLVNSTNKKIKLLSKPCIKYRLYSGNSVTVLEKEKKAINVIKKYKNNYDKKTIYKSLQKMFTTLGITAFRNKSKEFLILFAKALYYATLPEKLTILKTFGRLITKK